MAKRDKDAMNQLNTYWDGVVRGAPAQAGGPEAEFGATIRQLHDIDDAPAPDAAFAARLWQKLQEQPAPAKKASRLNGILPWPGLILGYPGPGRMASRFAIAALLVALVYSVTLIVGQLGQQAFQTPTVVAFEPDMARGVPVQAPLTIQFNTAMDRASVEKAFKLSPEVPGRFSWQGNAITFTPLAPGLKRGTQYTLVLDTSALSSGKQGLPAPFEATFMAADNLSVLSVQPFKDSAEVGRDSVISVQFNNPVVALTTAGASQTDPLVISPAVEGQGKWLTTAVYTFRPTAGLAPSTQYTVTVKKGITDTTGSALSSDYVWSFKTWTPTVTSVSPASNSKFVWIGTAITTTFNQPIDRPSLQERFHLVGPDGREVAGSFAWVDDETVVFTPDRQLGRATVYAVKIGAGVLGAKGRLGMAKELAASFTTVDVPRVVGSFPQNGARVSMQWQPVSIDFNQPMNRESVIANLEISPGPGRIAGSWMESDSRLRVGSVITQPSTHYRVVLKAGALDRYGQRLAEGTVIEFDTEPLPPSANLRVPGAPAGANSVGPGANPYALIEAINLDSVKIALYAIEPKTFADIDDKPGNRPAPLPYKLLRQWEVPARGELNASKVLSVPLGLAEGRSGLPAGLYAIQIVGNPPESGTGYRAPNTGILAVGKAAVTLKATTGEALVWVIDQATGQPLPDYAVTLFKQDGGDVKAGSGEIKAIATGKTDAKGLVFIEEPAIGTERTLRAFAEKDGDVGVAATGWAWTSGYSASYFNIPTRAGMAAYAMALYTERPIYRPGDKVYFKGVVRSDDDGKFSLPSASRPVNVVIRDPQYRVVFSRTVAIGEFGSFDGDLTLEKEAPTGNYTMQAGFDFNPTQYRPGMEIFSAAFLVAEFRKPDFEVKISTDRSEYIQGDEIAATVKADYFFGAPMADARVTWQVFQRPYIFTGPKDVLDGPYSFSDFESLTSGPSFTPGPKPIASGEGRTDANGNVAFRFTADIAKETMGQTFTIEATATDANNQQVSGRSDVVVHKGTFYIGVRPDPRVVVAGKAASVDLLTVDTRAVTVPNKLVNLELFEQKWYSVQEKGPDGRFRWTSKVERTLVGSATATTDATGKAKASLTPPRAGSYKILATARDERGNEVRSATDVYASGKEYVYWRLENNDRMELIADKSVYKPGETAKVLIPSPFPKAKALIAIERGHIISYETFDIESSSQVVEIPLTSAHAPNVYVAITVIQSEAEGGGKADFKVGYVELPVKADEMKLTIAITPDRSRYLPRETATYKIKTTDYQGKPVRTELSLALVDAAVLSLADERARDLFESFYGRRSLSVSTGQSLAKSLSKVDPTAFGYGKGGGGESQDARGFFPDVAYWNPSLKTDQNGEATVSIPLPDSLTTWRLTARGTTLDTIVGTERNDIVASKPVLVRPVVPRFLVVGDEVRFEAIVHNYSGDTLDADVSIAAQGVAMTSPAPQKVKVAAAGSAKVYWVGKVGKDREARITFQVQPVSPAGATRDAVETVLPILTYSSPEVSATSGEVRNTANEAVLLPANIDKELGELTIKMEPSLASGMEDGLAYLEGFPYECVEQTISRFLPNIATLRALDTIGIENRALKDRLPHLVSVAIQRLYGAQNPDGSWGWWPRDAGNPFITAYALYGLNEARREGFAVQAQTVDKAVGYLNAYLASSKDVYTPESPNLRAYVLYVLAETGKADRGTTVSLYERRDSLGSYGRAYLALALYDLNGKQADSRVKNLVEDLNSSALASATGVHWEEAAYDYKTMNTNNRTTAIVLDALVRIDPANPLIPGAVRWLMVSRDEGHWETTQETAMAVIALTDYLAMSGELDPSYSYEVAVNDKKIGGDKVTSANVNTQSAFAIPIPNLLVQEANKLRMSRYPSPGEQSVKGKLYYSLYLRYFLPVQNIAAKDEGVVVSREYLDADDRPVKGTALGDTVKVRLTIVAPQDLHYLILEDPLPAGVEAVDPALKTSSLSAQPQEDWRAAALKRSQEESGGSAVAGRDRWRFTHIDIRDEKVAFFATFLPKGMYEYTYLVRATTAGSYQALPATAYQMYFPEVWGRSAGEVFTIQ